MRGFTKDRRQVPLFLEYALNNLLDTIWVNVGKRNPRVRLVVSKEIFDQIAKVYDGGRRFDWRAKAWPLDQSMILATPFGEIEIEWSDMTDFWPAQSRKHAPLNGGPSYPGSTETGVTRCRLLSACGESGSSGAPGTIVGDTLTGSGE